MTLGSDDRPVEVLLVEDNPGDVKLTQDLLKDSEHKTNIAVAEDGEAAMAYLRKEGDYENAPRPDLILLDLRLPKKDGPAVMAEIYKDEDLAAIPIVILTGTEAERSLLETYDIPANRYLTKPVTLAPFDNLIRLMNLVGGLPGRMPIPQSQASEIGSLATGAQTSGEQEKKKWWWPFGG